MRNRFLKTAALVMLAAASTLALAQTPTRVGRISLSQGQVGIAGELGEETSAAIVNWPVTSRNQVTTGRNSRTEIRIGSTALRLDADSALDVTELDDDSLRLHLHYGSISVRVRNPEVLRGFEISTPQGLVRMQEAGRLRIDAGRRSDTTMVSVFDGVAVLDGGGSRLTVRSGRRAELGQYDVRTGLATRDGFDDWAMLRDERDERSESIRYTTAEMTGYEDLDRNGTWQDDREYGPLWSPRRIPVGWAPYRDGQWTYLQPWGWTWVDNAPWGYAPFHYGRWVMVDQRWSWAPGRNITRAVWSPALVGWVGGSGWNLGFNQRGTHRAAPATGWYPLAPREAYVPSYRMNQDTLRYVNRLSGDARDDVHGRYDVRRPVSRRAGLTIVPHDQFDQRGTVVVRGAPQPVVSATALTSAPVAAAPTAPGMVRFRGDFNGRDPRRFERDRDGAGRVDQVERRSILVTPTVPMAGASGQASPAGQVPLIRREGRFANDELRRDSRFGGDNPRPERAPRSITLTGPAPVMTPAPASPVAVAPAPAPAVLSQPRDERLRVERDRGQRDPDVERDRRPRGADAFQQRELSPRFQQRQIEQQMQQQQQQQMQQQQMQQQQQQQQMQQQQMQQQMQQQQMQQQQMQRQQQMQQQQEMQRQQQMQQQQEMQRQQQMQQQQQQQQPVQVQRPEPSPIATQPPPERNERRDENRKQRDENRHNER